MSSLGINRRVVNMNRGGAPKPSGPAKFEIFCDEDAPPPNKPEMRTTTNATTVSTTGNYTAVQPNQMNPPNNKKLQPLQAQPVHKNLQPLGEHIINNYRRSQMTVANLKKHDAQLQSNQEQQASSRTTTNLTNLKQQQYHTNRNNVQSLRTSLSTSSDVSELGIKTMSVEEAAEILQSRLAEHTAQCNTALSKGLASPPTPMSVDGGSVSIPRQRSFVQTEFKENDISFSDQENDDLTDIDDDEGDENQFYADEDGFDGSDISVSDQVHDSSVNFDVEQIFKCEDYNADIQDYLIALERTPALRPIPNYMRYQDEIDSSMRSVLIDWMVDVAEEHGLQHDTLFQAVSMVDRFLSVMGISTSSFQLLGVAALFTASKYEEIYPPDLYQFVNVTDKTYSSAQILNMEQLILKAVDFRISGPTSYYFLCKIFTFNSFPVQVYHLAEYLCYLTMMEDQPFLEYYPSEIAISAIILAVYQLGLKDLITEPMIEDFHKANNDQIERRDANAAKQSDRRSRSNSVDHKLPLCIEAIHAMQEYAPSHKQQAIYNKFSSMTYDCVSGLKPISNVQAVINL